MKLKLKEKEICLVCQHPATPKHSSHKKAKASVYLPQDCVCVCVRVLGSH